MDNQYPLDLHCSFCGKPRTQVEFIIAGPCVYLCDECLDICVEISEFKRLCWCPVCGASTITKQPLGECAVCDAPLRREDPNGELPDV